MSKEIAYDIKARATLKKGVDKLANAVRVTLGPKGRNVVIEKKFGAPTVTKDGVTVAKEIDLEDQLENVGAQMLREVASKIECPLYIVSGALDRVIPPKQGELLEKAAENSSEVIHQIIPNGGHVANNVSYFYRNKCADWMTEKLNS